MTKIFMVLFAHLAGFCLHTWPNSVCTLGRIPVIQLAENLAQEDVRGTLL